MPRMQRNDSSRYLVFAVLSLCVAAGSANLGAQTQAGQTPTVPPSCHSVQLEPFSEPGDCAMGRCYTRLELRNVSKSACTLPAITTVTAVTSGGTKTEDVKADKPLVLQPGAFGEYVSESYSKGATANPPVAQFYEFHLAPDDPSEIDFYPGDQGIAQGPQAVFDAAHPAPALSGVPHQEAGGFVVSAYFWPPLRPNAQIEIDSSRQNSLGNLHISLANHSGLNSGEWRYCQFVIDAVEEGTMRRQQSTAPCDWSGDVPGGVIEDGATVAMAAEVLAPKECHAARYTVTINMEKGPVRIAPMMLHTGQMQCSTAAPVSAAAR